MGIKHRKGGNSIGNTIHLYGVTTQAFLSNTKWVKHEICHIK